jgi:hypothetical protein
MVITPLLLLAILVLVVGPRSIKWNRDNLLHALFMMLVNYPAFRAWTPLPQHVTKAVIPNV